jgi:GR25 family glycosyltransferase involved in LPS biosynthesis
MKISGFVIHLKRATSRHAQAEQLCASLPFPCRVIDAVDGLRSQNSHHIANHIPGLFQPRYPFELRNGEIGAFLSHRACWQAILDEGLDAGLILEDDVALDKACFDRALALSVRADVVDSYIRFPVIGREKHGRTIAVDGEMTLFEPRMVGLGAQAQLVGKNAARRLLGLTESYDRPVDSLLQLRWLTNVPMLAVMPNGVTEISGSLGGSQIGKPKSLFERIHREFMRPYYRGRIAIRSLAEPLR